MICKDHSDNEALAACPWCLSAYWEMHYLQQKDRLAAAQAREAELVAHVERLKRALEMPCDRWSKKQHEIVKEVLESTPAQSLSRLRNEVLEEAAKKCEPTIWADVIRAMKEPE